LRRINEDKLIELVFELSGVNLRGMPVEEGCAHINLLLLKLKMYEIERCSKPLQRVQCFGYTMEPVVSNLRLKEELKV
jgi:hypothetical protein